MAALAGLVAISIAGTLAQRESILAQGTVAESNARIEARSARLRGRLAIRAGKKRAAVIMGRQDQLTGIQRASLAAQGIDPNSGTGAAVLIESRFFGDLDIIETQTNAKMEALGFKAQALSAEGRGAFARIAAKSQARQTLLTGGMSIARDFMMWGVHRDAKRERDERFAKRKTEKQFEYDFWNQRFARGR